MVSETTSRLKPSCFDAGPSQARPGMLASLVPGFQIADVLTYPLMVVAESALATAFSSACATEARLIMPADRSAEVLRLICMVFKLVRLLWFRIFCPPVCRT